MLKGINEFMQDCGPIVYPLAAIIVAVPVAHALGVSEKVIDAGSMVGTAAAFGIGFLVAHSRLRRKSR